MDWFYIIGTIYAAIVIAVCLRVIYETRSATKTMAYLLLILFIPIGGVVFYILFGINFWKTKLYNRKSKDDEKMLNSLKKEMDIYMKETISPLDLSVENNRELAVLVEKELRSPLTRRNKVKLLLNGEEKFPEVLEAIRNAKHHIHIEYYICEQDEIGKQILELLIQKANEGVKVRFIYDDFGSPTIKKKTEERMRKAGIEIYPRSEEHTSELQSQSNLVCRLLLEKKK